MWPMNKKWLSVAGWVLWTIALTWLLIWQAPQLTARVKWLFNNLVPDTTASLALNQWEIKKPNLAFELPKELKVADNEKVDSVEPKMPKIANQKKESELTLADMEPEAGFTPTAIFVNDFKLWQPVNVAYEIPGRQWSYVIIEEICTKKHQELMAISYTSETYKWNEPDIEEWASWTLLLAKKWAKIPWTWEFTIADMKDDNWVFYEKALAELNLKARPTSESKSESWAEWQI